MKKIIIAISCFFLAFQVSAQVTKDDIHLMQADYAKQKRDLMQEYMKFKNNASATEFWKIYDSYEIDRKKLGQDWIANLQDYAKNYGTLTDAKADVLIKKSGAINTSLEKLYSDYYEKMKKPVGAVTAGQWLQLEAYLQSSLKLSILDQVPFIGEIERKMSAGKTSK